MLKKILKIAYKILFWIVTVVVVLVCVGCIYTAVQRARGNELPTVFGFAAATVATGSMEPTISAGDLIIIKACDEYEEDDIITFYDSSFGGYITHRIVEISDGIYITRGDANTAEDSGVLKANVIGKVVLVIGGAGTVINFLQSTAGILCIIGVFAAICLIGEIIKILRTKKDRE